MTTQEIVRIIEATLVVAGVAAVFYAVFKSTTTKEIIRQQNEIISIQKERLDLLEAQHIENAKAIGELQGEINAYKKIPLEKIAKSIHQIATTNAKILTIIKEEGNRN
jgi:hypothetical protein